MNRLVPAALVGTALLTLAGCAQLSPQPAEARVLLHATRNSTTSGELRITPVAGGIHLHGQVQGLKPGALHGFHVHEKGDCSAPDALSAGGHFNPQGHPHGTHGHGAHHAGDLVSLQADSTGVARVSMTVKGLSLDSSGHNIRGTALVVHRDPDDGRSQPAGNAGPRIACGVIPA